MNRLLVFGLCLPFWIVTELTAEVDREDFLLGLFIANEVEKMHEPIDDHPEWERLVDITARVLAAYGRDEPLYTFRIIEAPVANAFALPGGFVFITDKLLQLEPTDDELAFLIGHEMAHVHRRHFASIQKEQTKVGIMNALATIGSVLLMRDQSHRDHERLQSQGAWERDGAPDTKSVDHVPVAPAIIPMLAGGIFGTLYLLHSQRELELDADHHGGDNALRAGYDLKGGTGMLEKLFYTNYRNPEHLAWESHPQAQARQLALESGLGGRPKVEPASPVLIADFRDRTSERLLDIYEAIPGWKVPMAMRSLSDKPESLRRLLLQRSRDFASGEEAKRRSLRLELQNHELPALKHSSFLSAGFGEVRDKMVHLKSMGEPMDDEQLAEMEHRAGESLAAQLEEMRKSTPGYQQYHFMLENFPSHSEAGRWKRMAWATHPDPEKQLVEAPEMLKEYPEMVEESLLRLAVKTDDPVIYRKVYLILKRPPDLKLLEKWVGLCKSLERLAIYQHEFPKDEHIDMVLARRKKLAEEAWQAGKLADQSNRPDLAVQAFRDLLLYDQGSHLEEKARNMIYRMNSIGGTK